MSNKIIIKYLKEHHINYETIKHPPAYTAQELAAVSHVPNKNFAKTVILKVDGKFIMMIEPANIKVNLETLRLLMGANKVELASEYEFQGEFPDCETGAMPPFGELFNMDVYMAESMKDDKDIAFNSGTHSETIKMSNKHFINLVKPHFIAA